MNNSQLTLLTLPPLDQSLQCNIGWPPSKRGLSLINFLNSEPKVYVVAQNIYFGFRIKKIYSLYPNGKVSVRQ